MNKVSVYQRGDLGHNRACVFSTAVYKEQLGFNLTNFPEYMFVTEDQEGNITGCMGLNTEIRCPLFCNDLRFAGRSWQRPRHAEQSVFAVSGYNPAIALLIAVVGEYAHLLGFHYVTTAAIGISHKLIKSIGLATLNFGLADEKTIPENERVNFQKWFAMHKPSLELIDTANTPEVRRRTAVKYRTRAAVNASLLRELESGC